MIRRLIPRIGRRYLEQPPQSTEALAKLAALPAGEADRPDASRHLLALGTVSSAAQPTSAIARTRSRSARSGRDMVFALGVLLGPIGCVSVDRLDITEEQAKSLSCYEIQKALGDAGAMADDAVAEQGVTVTNATAAAIVPFGLQVNQRLAADAEKANKKAIQTLYSEWDRKSCSDAIYRANKKAKQ